MPSRRAALAFRTKATLLQLRRAALNAIVHRDARFGRGEALAGEAVVGESVTRLWADAHARELPLQAGKVHNLRVALRRLHGVEVPAGAVFSFWRHVGRATRRRGYVRGRELREGCIIPNTGGGLCQLSNALYDAALKAGFRVVERHAHTRVIPGSLAEQGRDATIFWNYVDLRWRAPVPFRIEASLTRDSLIVRFRSPAAAPNAGPLAGVGVRASAVEPPTGSCVSCGVTECFRAIVRPAQNFGRTAYLCDEFWPEFDEYVGGRAQSQDLLCVPLDGRRFGKPNYAWGTRPFGEVYESRLATLRRAVESRRLAAQGAARQRALLKHAARLAEAYAARLAWDVTHVVVTQGLLPFLWRAGHLGGRTFEVLMTGLPLMLLQERLDAAHALHPESRTLDDFRTDDWLVRAEAEALAEARRVVTPHTEVAALFGGRAVLLDWHLPRVEDAAPQGERSNGARAKAAGSKVVFPAATVGRKGVYELREAARELGLPLVLAGAQLEGEDFWRGVSVERAGASWLDEARVVVLPSFVENRPRRLLEALARGVPVIASTACGLGNVPGVVAIPPGDARALRDALASLL